MLAVIVKSKLFTGNVGGNGYGGDCVALTNTPLTTNVKVKARRVTPNAFPKTRGDMLILKLISLAEIKRLVTLVTRKRWFDTR